MVHPNAVYWDIDLHNVVVAARVPKLGDLATLSLKICIAFVGEAVGERDGERLGEREGERVGERVGATVEYQQVHKKTAVPLHARVPPAEIQPAATEFLDRWSAEPAVEE